MTNPIYYKRISGSSIQGNAYTVIEPNGTIVVANGGELRLHDGSTAGGNEIVGGGGGFATTSSLVSGDYTMSLSSSTGVLTLSTASTILGRGTDPNVYIETSTTATTSIWTFGTNGELTLPAATPVIKGGGTGTDVTIIAQNTATTSTWAFGANGTITANKDLTIQLGVPIDVGTIGNSSGGWDANQGTNIATTGGAGTGLTVDIVGDVSGYTSSITIHTPGIGYTDGDIVTASNGGSYVTFAVTIRATDWQLGSTGTLTFPDATVQRSAYLTGQQTVHINTASTTTSIDLTELTGSIVMLYPEAGYTASGETHYVNLPFDTNSIALGTRITVLNYHPGNAIVSGWDGPGYTMSQFETIDLVYTFDPGYPGNIWWVTSSFVW